MNLKKKKEGPKGPSELVLAHPTIKTDASGGTQIRVPGSSQATDRIKTVALNIKAGRVTLTNNEENLLVWEQLIKDGCTDLSKWPTSKSIPSVLVKSQPPRKFMSAKFFHPNASDKDPINGNVAVLLPYVKGQKQRRQVQLECVNNVVKTKEFEVYEKMVRDGWTLAENPKYEEAKK